MKSPAELEIKKSLIFDQSGLSSGMRNTINYCYFFFFFSNFEIIL